MSVIRYGTTGQERYQPMVERLIVESGARSVCDLGGGAHPILDREFVERHGLRYVVADVSQEELDRAPDYCETLIADLAAADPDLPAPFDVAVSRWAAEHMPDARLFHTNVHRMLSKGGAAMHIFPTLYALPFLINRLLPDAISDRVLRETAPERLEKGDKFPAYYRWCRGPTRRQLRRLESVGFEVEEYVGLFGHHYYRGLRPLQMVEDRLARILARHPVPSLTSYAFVILRTRPGSDHLSVG